MKHHWKISFISEGKQSKEEINHFFKSKKNFECTDDTFEYFNLDTGVNFSFSLATDNNVVTLHINLTNSNSNTIREVIHIVSPLVEKFSLKVKYPDKSAVAEDYIIRRFIQKWHHIKRYVLDYHYDTVYFPVATAKVKSVWYWNYSYQWTTKFLKSLFKIPKLQFFNHYGKAHTVVRVKLNEWSAIPQADFYLMEQDESKGLFKSTPATTRLISHKGMKEIFAKCRFLPFEKTPFYKFRPEEFKSELKDLFNNSIERKVHTLEPSKIIDKEVYDGKKLKALEESTY